MSNHPETTLKSAKCQNTDAEKCESIEFGTPMPENARDCHLLRKFSRNNQLYFFLSNQQLNAK